MPVPKCCECKFLHNSITSVGGIGDLSDNSYSRSSNESSSNICCIDESSDSTKRVAIVSF